MTLVVIMSVMIIIFSKTPILPALSPIVVISTGLIVQKKYNNNFLLMLISGLISAFVYVGILIALGLLAKEYYWAEMIITFPY